jgi:hypothetical protein
MEVIAHDAKSMNLDILFLLAIFEASFDALKV